jgi:leucyl-tRNA synthetase
MELLNAVQRYGREEPPHGDVWSEALDALLLLLAVMTPHVTAELWDLRHPGEPSVHQQPWPEFDPELVRQETVTMVVQVNGKVRDRVEVDAAITEADAVALALALPKVAQVLDGAAPKRVVARPPRLVNVVV